MIEPNIIALVKSNIETFREENGHYPPEVLLSKHELVMLNRQEAGCGKTRWRKINRSSFPELVPPLREYDKLTFNGFLFGIKLKEKKTTQRQEPSIENINSRTGLTTEEQQCMDNIAEAFNIFSDLERQHPDELKDFRDSIHRMQDILAVRVARRNFPEGWPSYTGKLD